MARDLIHQFKSYKKSRGYVVHGFFMSYEAGTTELKCVFILSLVAK